jgi:hypothetical protein
MAIRRPSPAVAVDQAPRCWRCGRKLAEYLARPWLIVCQRCKAKNGYANDAQMIE